MTATNEDQLDPAADRIIEHYLHALTKQLPGPRAVHEDVVEEIRQHLIDATMSGAERQGQVGAARAAVADFGDPADIAAGLRGEVASRHVNRVGRILYRSGHLVGLCWLAVLITSSVASKTGGPWVALFLASPAVLVGAPATMFAMASTGRLSRWISIKPRVPLAATATAGIAATVGDAVMVASILIYGLALDGAVSWPLVAIACAASAGRVLLAARAIDQSRQLLAADRHR